MSNAQLALPGVVATDPDLFPAGSGGAEVALRDEWVWSDDTEEETEVFVHATVMKDEVLVALTPRSGGVYVDVTLGGGGHTEAILLAAEGSRVIAFDRDIQALTAAKERLAPFGDRVTYVKTSFGSVREELDRLDIKHVDGLCADLGVSSPQLDDAERGMSFRREGPIDMRMDQENGETALELIDRLGDEGLADVIYRYGDERRSRRIARSIRRALGDNDLNTTLDLRRAIVRAVGPVRVGGVDPATRTFQALRIAVNRELEELEALLAALPSVIGPGGVATLITFHSLEDRQVKHTFQRRDEWTPIWKKPLTASEEERALNARARSAKLRAARRMNESEQEFSS